MTVAQNGSVFVLVVRGPGTADATHQFSDMPSLLAFASAHEERLTQAGFQLQAISERRSGSDRGGTYRGGTDLRRSEDPSRSQR
jgi:hypothetical protein